MPSDQRFDRSLKHLITGSGLFFAEKFLGLEGTGETVIVDSAFPAILHREADCVLRHTDHKGNVNYVHFEFQSAHDPDMSARMLMYYVLIWIRFGNRPLQLLIHLNPRTGEFIHEVRHPNLSFRYDVVYLPEQPLSLFLDQDHPSEIILGVLSDYPDDEEKIRLVIERLAEMNLSPNGLADYLAVGEIISDLLNLKETFINLRKNMALNLDISKSTYFQQGKQAGFAEGTEAGMAEGKKEGMKEGKLDSALSLWRSGIPPEEVRKLLNLDAELWKLFSEKINKP